MTTVRAHAIGGVVHVTGLPERYLVYATSAALDAAGAKVLAERLRADGDDEGANAVLHAAEELDR